MTLTKIWLDEVVDLCGKGSFPASDPPPFGPPTLPEHLVQKTGEEDDESRYNYERFRHEHYDLDSFEGPAVGDRAPPFQERTPEGKIVRLSDFLGQKVLLEFASLSCPHYRKRVPEMNRLTWKYPDVQFLVLYVREAHPGRNMPAHRTFAEKVNSAKKLRTLAREMRQVLVDGIDGATHRIYGCLPNMAYLIDEDGIIRYRSSWTDPVEISTLLSGLQLPRNRPRHGVLPPDPPGLLVTLKTLWQSGPEALWDFLKALPSLRQKYGNAPGRQEKTEIARASTLE